MKRMIPIVDLKTGEVSVRWSDTSTFDVPADFDRDAGVASLVNSQAHYRSTIGRNVSGPTSTQAVVVAGARRRMPGRKSSSISES
jgi:hypothetical protein